MLKPDEAMVAIPVTNEAAAVVKLTVPAEVAPAGAAKLTLKVTPDGKALPNIPVILRAVLLVVTAYVVVASVALVGALPATAVVILNAPGFPEIEMASMDPMVQVIFAVAVNAPCKLPACITKAISMERIPLKVILTPNSVESCFYRIEQYFVNFIF